MKKPEECTIESILKAKHDFEEGSALHQLFKRYGAHPDTHVLFLPLSLKKPDYVLPWCIMFSELIDAPVLLEKQGSYLETATLFFGGH